MKKLLIAGFLGLFFICVFSVNAADDILSTVKIADDYEKAGKINDAKKTWEGVLAKVTNDPVLYDRYAEFLNRTGDVYGAIEQFKKVQKLVDPKGPVNTTYTFRITEILAANGKQDEAKAILTKLINESKDSWAIEEAKRRLKMLEAPAPNPQPK